jgi:4-alpha-glucanotransferase
MRVLWFEQPRQGGFRPPRDWSRTAAAMTTTHDLPTVLGWWRGRDIDWRERLSLFPEAGQAAKERERRRAERGTLWTAFLESGAATGDEPGAEARDPVLDAALAHVGGTACQLAILPMEDALALVEQPNLPGTVEGHPNWQRRLPGEAAALLEDEAVARRLEVFALARPRGGG